MAGDDAALVAVLHGLLRDVAQAARARISILVHVEVQVQIALGRQGEDPNKGSWASKLCTKRLQHHTASPARLLHPAQ